MATVIFLSTAECDYGPLLRDTVTPANVAPSVPSILFCCGSFFFYCLYFKLNKPLQ